MYKLDLPIDLKEQAAIERRRRLEKERQSRIFNNKHRLIGVFNNFFLNFLIIIIFIYYFNLNLKIDKTSLDQQVEDKKFMEEMERKRSEAFGI